MERLRLAFWGNFLGNAPDWYKWTIIGFLVINPLLMLFASPYLAGWVLVLEFIFTLAMALKCYPLQPGGLLALEAVALGMTHPDAVYQEVLSNFPVILLLMFMVAAIFFMRELLLFVFTKILLGVRSKVALSVMFSLAAAVLSAFLDALTVTAVIISVAAGFYAIYHRVACNLGLGDEHDVTTDAQVQAEHAADLEQFRSFLRSLLMHAAVGTALGGVCTLVGEPQNLLIATKAGWEFIEFFVKMAPVTMPVLVTGLLTCLFLEMTHWFGYGETMPESVRGTLERYDAAETAQRTEVETARLWIQAFSALFLMLGLAFHIAEVGLIGLAAIVLKTTFNGIIHEHQLGKAFEEALPFTALLVVFFSVVAVIHEQHLFQGVINWVLAQSLDVQPALFFVANGALSAISDNVFVATVYINEVRGALDAGTISREHFDKLTIAINTGTNIPSVATPNGQAAFLFLLTSAIAPLVRLSYMRMVIMALPYTISMSIAGLLAVILFI